MTELKQLPRDANGNYLRNFTANGQKYVIRSREDGLGIHRTSEFLKMELVNGIGMGISEVDERLKDIQFEINQFGRGKGDFAKCGLLIKALREEILKITSARYPVNFLFCTLFIVREGEDMTKWVIDEQNEKIDDWNAEGYNEIDFLELGLSMVRGFAETSVKYSQQPGSQTGEAL